MKPFVPGDDTHILDGTEEVPAFMREAARTPAIAPEMLQADMLGQVVANRFELVERIGIGGMGVVYKAEDRVLKRQVAVKLIRPVRMLDPKNHEALIREAQSAAAINHPNIAAVYDAGQAGGVTYLAMELVDGETLRARLARGPLIASDALAVARQMAAGLAQAHESAIIHRDLKPDNIVLTRKGEVKILDFGIAHRIGDDRHDVIAGTPRYMAPEQQRADGDVDARTDVYAFGLIVFEMLTGRAQPLDAAAMRRAPREQRALLKVAARCVALDPADRFVDGRALQSALTWGPRVALTRTDMGLAVAASVLLILGAGALAALKIAQVQTRTRTEREFHAALLTVDPAFAQRIDSFRALLGSAVSDPIFRSQLTLAMGNDAEMGLGDVDEDDKLRDIHEIFASAELPIFKEHPLVAVVGANGQLLFSRARPALVGTSVAALDIVDETLRTGQAARLWSVHAGDTLAASTLFAADADDDVFLVVGKAVLSGTSTVGVVLVGESVQVHLLADLERAAHLQVQIATLDGHAVGPPPARDLVAHVTLAREVALGDAVLSRSLDETGAVAKRTGALLLLMLGAGALAVMIVRMARRRG